MSSAASVSTHSRPKAAASFFGGQRRRRWRFNTQPPEGGCRIRRAYFRSGTVFQHTAARRRLQHAVALEKLQEVVSTHSRPKAAAFLLYLVVRSTTVSTHSRPKAAARNRGPPRAHQPVSTHSRPKAAASGWGLARIEFGKFQHTAARRRLRKSTRKMPPASCFNTQPPEGGCAGPPQSGLRRIHVSTHSRPKAAAAKAECLQLSLPSFNTQPPEGGCGACVRGKALVAEGFNTQPPEGGCNLT